MAHTPRKLTAALVLTLVGLSTVTSTPTSARVIEGVAAPGPESPAQVSQVVVISLDGLTPRALTRLGRAGTPVLHQMMDEGAYTLNARTAYELTVTLPNHTSMVTGRRIDPVYGGHGVTWNDDRKRPSTVQRAAGVPVESVFSAVHAAGLGTALLSSKTKFSLWQRSWPTSFDFVKIREERDKAITLSAVADLRDFDRALTFVHLGKTDKEGHARGWMSPRYLDAVRDSDARVGEILAAIDAAGEADETLVVVTADHGGVKRNHSDASRYLNYRIPFLVVGPGVPAGADLYDLNPAYLDPGRGRPTYDEPLQPIRNGSVTNLVTDVLGLPAVPGSEIDTAQNLEVFAP
jgi:hypothetical protein